jgi:uncharacterized protein YegP (UPF0339 family)
MKKYIGRYYRFYDGRWYIQLVSRNGKVITQFGGYMRLRSALKILRSLDPILIRVELAEPKNP